MGLNGKVGAVSSRDLGLALLDAVLVHRRLLDEAFEDLARGMGAELSLRDRAFARMLVATTLRRLGQIDALLARCLEKPLAGSAQRATDVLRLGACQLLFLNTPAHAAIATSVDLLKNTRWEGFAKLVNAVLRRLDREGRAWVLEQDGPKLNTPPRLWQRWVKAYGEPLARAIISANLTEAATDFSLKTPTDAPLWAEKLEAEILPTGSLRRASGGDITQLAGFDQAAWWVQDVAAALPVQMLGSALQGRRVGDLCAAPGGKTLQLAAAGALVTAVDHAGGRLERLRDNLRRLDLMAEVVEADALTWRPSTLFDDVLLDAPCSATGTLRRHPDGLHLKANASLSTLTRTQGALLDAAVSMLRPGGRLIYCVCSLEPEEGVQQIERFLAGGAPLRRLPILASEVRGLEEALTPEGDLRTLPCHLAEQGGMDAFYVARFERLT